MASVGTPPVIPSEYQPYNSYETDPVWQLKFTYAWIGLLGLFSVISFPSVIRAIRRASGAYAPKNWFGITEEPGTGYQALKQEVGTQARRQTPLRKIKNVGGFLGGLFYWTIPGIGLNAGQVSLLAGYVSLVILCIVKDSALVENSNRAGFLAIAQLPIAFLLGTKNSIVSFLLGPGNGYEKLNFIHRWSGRIMFLAALVHGSLWIKNDLTYNLPILSEEKESAGIRAFALLGTIVLFSLKPIRKFFYQGFFVLHIALMVAFFISICYHTPYAVPWIFPPLAFYGLDIFLRLLRHRIKDAVLVPVGKQMTLIHIPYVTSGWVAGQHVRLRVFISGRVLESHPLTICSAPPDTTCISSFPPGISLGARAVGDWTRALNTCAQQYIEDNKISEKPAKDSANLHAMPLGVPVHVMVDGPYGGCSVDLGDYESVLLFAGGSGITFTLGLLDDIIGRCVKLGRRNGERTRRIEFAWCIRSFGQIEWFSKALIDIATIAASSSQTGTSIDVHISIFVTCLCNPEAVPAIPNSDVTIMRPSVRKVLLGLSSPPNPRREEHRDASSSSQPHSHAEDLQVIEEAGTNSKTDSTSQSYDVLTSDVEAPDFFARLPWIGNGGGVAVCASGPASLATEASNAVAAMQLNGQGAKLGGLALHTEVFDL